MVTIVLIGVIILSTAGTVFIVVRQVPKIATLPEHQLVGPASKHSSSYRRLARFFGVKGRVIMTLIVSKAIRGLRFVSAKTDKLATRLLDRVK